MEEQIAAPSKQDTLTLRAPYYYLRMIALDFAASLFAIFGFLFKANLIHMQKIGFGLLILGLVELFFYMNYRVTFNTHSFCHRGLLRRQKEYRYEDIEELGAGEGRLAITMADKHIEVAASNEKGRLFMKIAQAKGAPMATAADAAKEEPAASE